jgi:hypothetical protein
MEYDTMLGVINDSPRYFSHSGTRRADIRFGQGPSGEIYIMNKRNNTIYLVTNSLAEGDDRVNSGGENTGPDEGEEEVEEEEIQPTSTSPTAPGNLRHALYSGTTAEIFWDRSSDDGFVQGYEIIRNGESLGIRDVLSIVEEGLDPTVSYRYIVKAVDNEGNRSPAAVVSFLSDTSSRPATPNNLRHQVYSQRTAEIFWDRATDDGIVRGYEITRNGESLGIRDALSVFEEELNPEVIYTYQVTSIDNQGNRSGTATMTLATGNANRPTTPANVRHELYSSSSAEIFWDRATDGGTVVGYEIIRNGDSLGVHDALSLVERDLDPAVTYIYEVTAINSAGFRSNSATTTLSTSDRRPPVVDDRPAPPQGLRATVYSETAAELFWEWSEISVLWFEVKRDGVVLTLTNSINFFDDSLEGNTTYYYEVVVIDRLGNRSDPSSVSITTPWSN